MSSPTPPPPVPTEGGQRQRSSRRRLIVLGVTGLSFALAVLGYRYFWLGRPIGDGPAGPTVARAAFERVWSDRKVVLLGFGDSVTAGGLRVHKAYNDVIARCAERRDDVELVDIQREFLGHGIHCRQFWHRHYRSADPTYWYYDNLEDPHDRGYDAIRRMLLIEMSRVLPQRLASLNGRSQRG